MSDFEQWLATSEFAAADVLKRGWDVTWGVVRNAKVARERWSLWEALNERLEPPSAFAAALQRNEPKGFGALRMALAESTVLAILRVSENAKNSGSLSALVLSGILSNSDVVETLCSERWLTGRQSLSFEPLETRRIAQRQRINWLVERLPDRWDNRSFPPEKSELFNARQKLIAWRDKRIAHTDEAAVSPPSPDDVRTALDLAIQIGRTASFVFVGWDNQLGSDFQSHVAASREVWDVLSRGLGVEPNPAQIYRMTMEE